MKNSQIKEKLALYGGKPILSRPLFPIHNIDERDVQAVVRVLRRGPLSGFLAMRGSGFLGGPEVRKLEKAFVKKFKVRYGVAFNSATTALHAAVASLGIGPGDEVIVPPFTMSASATAVLMNGAVPIFADIDERTFCLDLGSVRKQITKYTKAILVVNLFGGTPDFAGLLKIAREFNLKIIEDNAQGPGALYRGRCAGTIGDVGVFSFNVHKTMQTGEGGVLVTNNSQVAYRARLSRNHGEVIVDQSPEKPYEPIMGSNYRPTEYQAALACQQLKKLDFLNKKRIILADYLTKKLHSIRGLTPAYVAPGTKHVFYRYPILINERALGLSRKKLARAMQAEGFPLSEGYVKPIYLMALFKKRQVFNKTHFPFKSNYYHGKPDYAKGICPVVERMFERELIVTDVCQYPYTKKHVDLFFKALKKVLKNRNLIGAGNS